MIFLLLTKKRLIISCVICVVCMVGDINSQKLGSNDLAHAVCDNLTHAIVGVFTWIGMFPAKRLDTDFYFILEVILCGICSSAIDVDHFIAAKSINLKDATKLKNRPFLHCTTLAVLVVTCVMLVSYLFELNFLYKFGWILTAAFLSHHIRDSHRRGFWLWPLGSTGSTPFLVYMAAQMLLPHLLSVFMSQFFPSEMVKRSSILTAEIV